MSNQLLAAISCNIISFSFGTVLAFTTCSYMLWTTDATPLPSGKLSVVEASLVTSLMCIGCLIGNFVFISLTAQYGRKIPLMFLAIPQLVMFTLFYVATNVYYLYVARFLCGVVGGGLYLLVPLYISEIADDNHRGMLGSFLTLTSNAGMLFGFAVGTYLEYYTQLKVLILLPIAFLITFNYFPESPAFLRKQKNQIAADKSYSFFQGIKYVPTLGELNQEKELMNIEADDKPATEAEQDDGDLTFSDFLKPAAKKAIFIGIMLTIGNQMCGAWPLMTYTQAIFHEAGSSVSPNVCAIVASISQLTANLFAALLAERIDRKKLFSSSAICMGLGLIAMGLHSIYKEQLTHLGTFPVIAFSFAIFTASCGILPLHYVVLAEIMPKKIQNVANMLCMTLLWIMASVILQIYPTMSDMYGAHTCMFIFAISSFLLAAFMLIVVPETRGRSHETIMRSLAKTK